MLILEAATAALLHIRRQCRCRDLNADWDAIDKLLHQAQVDGTAMQDLIKPGGVADGQDERKLSESGSDGEDVGNWDETICSRY